METNVDALEGARYEDTVLGDKCTVVDVREAMGDERGDAVVVLDYDSHGPDDSAVTVPLKTFRRSAGISLVEIGDE